MKSRKRLSSAMRRRGKPTPGCMPACRRPTWTASSQTAAPLCPTRSPLRRPSAPSQLKCGKHHRAALPRLEFLVDDEAIDKVRLALDRAHKASKRQRVSGPASDKEKDAATVAAVAAHKKELAKANLVQAPFLVGGRPVDAQGKAVRNPSRS